MKLDDIRKMYQGAWLISTFIDLHRVKCIPGANTTVVECPKIPNMRWLEYKSSTKV